MKRTVMAILVAGALLLSAGSVTLFADPMGGENPDHPGVVHEPSRGIDPEAGAAGGDVSGSESNGVVVAGRKPGLGVGSGGDVLSSDPCPPLDCPPPAKKLAGSEGGIFGDTVIAGGRGGIFGDC